MSSCLIITQGNKMFIGADTACSIKTKDGYKRLSDNMLKLFSLGQNVFFCSGKKTDAEKCINWIYKTFVDEIDIVQLKKFLIDEFSNSNTTDDVFNIEFILCNYDNYNVIQLSQYNDFEPIIYEYSNQLRVICGGYKTNNSFLMAKKNILLNKSTTEIYKNVFEDISDECVGGNLIIYNSPIDFVTIKIKERDISYACKENDIFLLTSDFVTSGVVNGSQIIGGEIFSENYTATSGTYFNLNSGNFSLAGGKITYNGDVVTLNGVSLQWNDIENANSIATQITKDTVTTSYVNALKVTAKDVVADWVYAGNVKAGQIKTGVITSTDGNSTVINLDNGTMSFGKGALSWNGSVLSVSGNITTGNLTATGGKIANFNIEGGYLYNGLGIGIKKSCGLSCGASLGGSDDWIFWAGNGAFRVDINGGLYASNLNVTGGSINVGNFSMNSNGDVVASNIKATGGSIGGASLDTQGVHFYNGSTGWGLWGTTAHANIAFHAGANGSNIGGAPFRVYHDGAVVCSNLTINGGSISVGNFSMDSSGNVVANSLTANNANISGVLKAGTNSSIGIFKVDSNSIYSGYWDGDGADVFMSTGTSGAYTIADRTANDWAFGAGGNFGVTTSGHVYGTYERIGNVVLTGSAISIETSTVLNKESVSYGINSASWNDIINTTKTSVNSGYDGMIYLKTYNDVKYDVKVVNGIITTVTKVS